MKKNQLLLMALFLGITFTNCKNDNEENLTPITATEFAALRQNFLNELTQTRIFDAASGLTFTSSKGVQVDIYSLSLNGQPVTTGDVQLRYIELFDIGSMALANKPLVGTNLSGTTTGPLVTGGEFFIEVTQNSVKLDGNATLQVPVSFTQGADPNDMTIWTIEDEDDTTWEEIKVDMDRPGQGANNYYYCWLPSFCWTNIDWLYSLPGEKTEVRVKVPEGYDDSNSSVYVAYLTMPNTLASFDVYDKTGKYFTEHTGLAPIGFQMFVVFISGDAKTGQFVYATKLVTIERDQYITFAASDIHGGSIQQIINAINSLYD
jgi:hypothetical protein